MVTSGSYVIGYFLFNFKGVVAMGPKVATANLYRTGTLLNTPSVYLKRHIVLTLTQKKFYPGGQKYLYGPYRPYSFYVRTFWLEMPHALSIVIIYAIF